MQLDGSGLFLIRPESLTAYATLAAAREGKVFEVPEKHDLERNLRALIQDARTEVKREQVSAVSYFASRGIGGSPIDRALVEVVDSSHKKVILESMTLAKEFGERMHITVAEISSICRPLLTCFGNELVSEITDDPQLQDSWRAKFDNRLDAALRDLRIGFIDRKNVAVKDADRREVILKRLYEMRHIQSWVEIPSDNTASPEEQRIASNICTQLAEAGLVEWKGLGTNGVMARITARGVDVIEGNAAPPIAIGTLIVTKEATVATSTNYGTIGNQNFGEMIADSIKGIEGNVNTLLENKETEDVGKALEALTQAVKKEQTLPEDKRTEILQQMNFLGQQATSPPEKRQVGLIKPIIDTVSGVFSGIGGLAAAWATWGTVIRTFFGF